MCDPKADKKAYSKLRSNHWDSDSLLKKELQNDQGRHEILNTLLEKTNGNEFYLTGDITGEEISISILGKELFKDELYATPALAFEYPFYYIQEQGNILQYARKMKVDNYYIMPDGAYQKNLIPFFESDLLHEFYEDWTQQNYSLVYIRKEK